MSRKYNKLPSLSNVSAGSTATLEVPLGVTYQRIMLEYSGVTAAQIKNIEVLIDGKAIWKLRDGTMLNDLNEYYQRNPESGVLDFWFIRPEFDNIDLRLLTAIGTIGVKTFQIKFDIDDAATNPKVSGYATKSVNSELGMITKIKMYEKASSVEGVQEVDNIPKEGRWAAVHHYGKGDISEVELSANSNEVIKLSKVLSEKIQRDYKRTPLGAKGTTIDFILEGSPFSGFPAQNFQDVRFRPNLDTAGAYTLLVEYLTQIDGL
ncbi:major capsid protein P2 [Idiomarina sp.]|uniref:major capsid protein P2 n=1 Tax=Idiomarina sp. TaxID=1874361 RepID=UPI0025864C18|nr:major capsid protein P2 [Idiomarina sp.]